ncbi:hypothetical protein ACXR2U_14915 [Jatrophihabitans sp. YIM 134969]
MTGPDLLSRYRAGERDGVWRELRDSGTAAGPTDQVRAVCDEMAHRARQNVEVLVERLTASGYRFHLNDDDRTPTVPHVPPTAGAVAVDRWLMQRFGAVPMTLLAWLAVVGDTWLVGTHPEWPESAAADPLVIEVEGTRYPAGSWQTSLEDDAAAWAESGDAEPFVLTLSPDRLHKANVSGGDPYGIVVPDAGVDGRFMGETSTWFVDHLNATFARGGFPAAPGSGPGERITRELARDLLPL